MKANLKRNIFILLLGALLIFGFQNCGKLGSLDLRSFGGGEPYPGTPAASELLAGYTSDNIVCADGLKSDEISFTQPDIFTERRENCIAINRTIAPSSINWINYPTEFQYSGKTYKIVK